MEELLAIHQNPPKLPIPKKDLNIGIFIIAFALTLYLIRPAYIESLLLIPIYFFTIFLGWHNARSMNFKFYRQELVIDKKQIPYQLILRVFETNDKILVVTKSIFFTKRYELHHVSEEIKNVLRDKVHPKAMNIRIKSAVKVSLLCIYITSGMSLLYFIISLTDVQISGWISMSFFVNALLLLISSNLYFWLHTRYVEYIKLD